MTSYPVKITLTAPDLRTNRSFTEIRRLARGLGKHAPVALCELAAAVLAIEPASGAFVAFEVEYDKWRSRR